MTVAYSYLLSVVLAIFLFCYFVATWVWIKVVDRNKQIILGKTEELLKLEPLGKKWKSFGWNVFEVDGHKYSEIIPTFKKVRKLKNGKPSLIIANTIKGKGES